MEFDFGMKFKVNLADQDIDALVECLGKAGCDDAVVGVGVPGRVALSFTREAASAKDAIISALRNVKKAIQNAELIEVTPDFVGLTDVAELIGVTRQNMRKLMQTHPTTFPPPVHEGTTSIWHLADVLEWLVGRGYSVQQPLLDIARLAMQVNLARAARQIEARVEREVRALVA